MALKFLNKKGWHTGSLRNIENVWKAEQKHEAEQKKLEELRKQIHEERERAEFRQLQEQAGLVPKQERLDFLYDSGLAVGKGSSGFKALESLPKTDPETTASTSASAKQSEAPGALFEDKPQSANDAWRKLHSDPLLLIRQREQEALARVKNNPIQMAMIRKSVQAKNDKDNDMDKDERKHRKKHHRKKSKHRKHSSSENDSDSEDDAVTVGKQEDSHQKGSKTDKHSLKAAHTSDEELIDEDARRKKYYGKEYKDRRPSGTRNPKYDKSDDQQKSREYEERRPSRTHNPKNDKSDDQQKSREYKDRRPSGSHNPKYDRSDDQQKNKRSYHESRREEYSSERQVESRHDKRSHFSSDKPPMHDSNNRRRNAVKLSDEERAARLREMQMDAERHEEQRWKRLKKAADSDAQEAIHDNASSGRNFLDAAQKSIYGAEKGGSSTIEESVRRRTHYLQGRSATESNAFRRSPTYVSVTSWGRRNCVKTHQDKLDIIRCDKIRSLDRWKSVSVPLNPGESLGVANYYTRIGLGTPPTYHLVVVDTGSSFSWIQCEPCAVYCHPQVGSRFDPAASHTYQRLSCETSQCSSLKSATLNNPMCTSSNTCLYTATYGDQSVSIGYLSKDSLTFGTESLPGFVFGCGQDNDGLFGKSAGLVGLAKNELSMLSQLSTKYGKVFSYCLPTATPLGATGSGGFLSIGTSSNSGYKFTPMVSDSRDPTLYFLKLSGLSVSGKLLGLAATDYNVPTIIDSGTTISRLAGPVYSALREELVRIISSKYKMAEAFSILDACFIGSFHEISSIVPSVQMIFQGGAEINLLPQNVVLEVEKGTTCLSFAGNSNLRDIAIIGNQQQQTFEIVYDLASSRIGFAAGGCR
ncbi:UNVERIFIED_CONTAM: Aspartyl protease family protein 2 [Sesamum latifolium]|uniref:Aspartyl protease family protein 2 n=1 Tax=Sesamum latifolium TaxID=2727402 RepID=A0AAW2WPA9_9LAMI